MSETGEQQEKLLSTASPVLYGRRWLMLTIFCVATMVNACFVVAFAPLPDQTSAYWAASFGGQPVPDLAVQGLFLVAGIAVIPAVFYSSWFFERFGLRNGVLMGAFLTMAGGWLRVGALRGDLFWLLFVGQLIAAFGQPFLLFSPTLLAMSWFGPDERTIATALASLTNPIGTAVGFAIAPPIVEMTLAGIGAPNFPALMYFEAILASLVLVLVFVAFKSRPPTPPTIQAAEQAKEPPHFCSSFKQCMKNGQFWILLVAFGLGYGSFIALAVILGQVATSWQGYSNNTAGMFGALLTATGLVSAGFVSVYVDKTRNYKPVFRIGVVAFFLMCLMFCFIVKLHMEWLIAITCVLISSCGNPLLPVCLELGVEVTYPVPEATSTGLLLAAGNFLSLIIVAVMSVLTPENNDMTIPLWLWLGCLGPAVILAFLARPKYKRYEQECKSKQATIQG